MVFLLTCCCGLEQFFKCLVRTLSPQPLNDSSRMKIPRYRERSVKNFSTKITHFLFQSCFTPTWSCT